MRPAQQNRRMRGRGNNNTNNTNNNNRKGPNPLSRNYESNGPDVKVRGNAQHIAEKYTTLARDSHASGDRVMAENYLQHAEHYNRIVFAAQAQNPQAFQREENFDDEGGDEEDNGFAAPLPHHNPPVAHEINGSGPQPFIEGTPAEVIYGEDGSESSKPAANEGRNHSRDQHSRDQSRDQGRDQAREQRRPMRPRRQPRVEHGAAGNAPVGQDDPQPQMHEAPQPVIAPQPVVAPQPAPQPVIAPQPAVASQPVVRPRESVQPQAAQPQVRAPRPKPEVAQPMVEASPAVEAKVVAEKPAKVEAAAPVAGEEEAPVRRRPGRPRRVVKDAEAPAEATEAKDATPASSDA